MHDMRGQDSAWTYTGDFCSDPSATQGQHDLYGYPGPSVPHPGSPGDGRVQDSEPQGAGRTPQMDLTPSTLALPERDLVGRKATAARANPGNWPGVRNQCNSGT